MVSKLALQDSFPKGYISDPVVGLLFTLFIHSVDDVRLTDVELLSAVRMPYEAVARRWLKVLEGDGLIASSVVEDGVHQIELTEFGVGQVRQALRSAADAETRVRTDTLKARPSA